MARCRSWRYVDSGHSGHRPGECRTCWRPCRDRLTREQVKAGVRRCDDCTEALLFCPDVAVRKALVEEPDLPRDVLVALTTDASGPVAFAAARRLEALDAAAAERAEVEQVEAVPVEVGVVIPEPVKTKPKRAHGRERTVWS